MPLQKKDFIEVEFTAKLKDGEIFDSNKKEDLGKSGLKGDAKPFVFALGEGMFLNSIDDYLIGKEVGEYKIELTPDKAFGKRDPKMIQMLPLVTFRQQQVNPIPGAVFNFDGKLARVLTVSGGRVMVDFNNPLAGKDVIYELNILRKIDNVNDKIMAVNEFFFRRNFEYKIEGTALKMKAPKGWDKFIVLFKDKYKELLNLEVSVEEEEEDLSHGPHSVADSTSKKFNEEEEDKTVKKEEKTVQNE